MAEPGHGAGVAEEVTERHAAACHNGAMHQGSMRRLATRAVGGTGGATPRVPWDWTDVVIFFGAYLLGVSVLSGFSSTRGSSDSREG